MVVPADGAATASFDPLPIVRQAEIPFSNDGLTGSLDHDAFSSNLAPHEKGAPRYLFEGEPLHVDR